jgi:sortase A
MNKRDSSRSKLSIVNILSLGSIILGIGFICWSLIHIRAQSVQINDIVSSSPITTTLPETQPTIVASNGDSVTTGDSVKSDEAEILYPVRPAVGDNIGTLTIPALNQAIPIIHGADEDELKKGVGHFAQSVLPGEDNNSVLSGHRDTVFRELGKLKIGDQLVIHTSAGTFTYEIKQTRIVHKDDKTVIVPTDHAVLTVTTCYPFRYIGDAPDRYIITSDLVKSDKTLG